MGRSLSHRCGPFCVSENSQKQLVAVAAQHGVAAERLDRGVFGIQKQNKAIPIYERDTFQPPAEYHTLGPHVAWEVVAGRRSLKITRVCPSRRAILRGVCQRRSVYVWRMPIKSFVPVSFDARSWRSIWCGPTPPCNRQPCRYNFTNRALC